MSCEIENKIKKSRSSLKQTSLDAYVILLRKLRRDLNPTGDINCFDFLKDFDKVKTYLEKLKTTTQRNKTTAIIVLLKSDDKPNEELIKKYTEFLGKLNGKYNEFLDSNEKTEAQKKNWIEFDEIVYFADKLMKRVKLENIRSKTDLTRADFDLLQSLVIVKTYLEYPLRNDFADMKVVSKSELDKLPETKNYLVVDKSKMEFILNEYKNKERLGKKTYEIPKNLITLYKLWLKFNKSGWFLVQSKDRMTPLSPNNLTKYINKIFKKEFGKKISTSMIRHITISEMKKNDPTIKELQEKEKALEDKFLHSGKINDTYRKI